MQSNNSEQQVKLWCKKGSDFVEKGQYKQALQPLEQAKKILLQIGPNYEYLAVQNEIAKCHIYLSKIDEGQAILKEVLHAIQHQLDNVNLSQKLIIAYHQLMVSAYLNRSTAFGMKRDFEQSLRYNHKGLHLATSSFGLESITVATCYSSMASMYFHQGNYSQALFFHEKALAIQLNKLGELHSDTVLTYNDMIVIYNYKGDYQQALFYAQKAESIYLQLFGEDHPELGFTYANIGIIYSRKHQHQQALCYMHKSLNIYLKIFGETHRHTAFIYTHLGNTYRIQKQYPKALDYLHKAQNIYGQLLGKTHETFAFANNTLGMVYAHSNQLDKALAHFEKASSILDEKNKYLAYVYTRIGLVYHKKKNFQKQLDYCQKALHILIPEFTTDSIYENPDSTATCLDLIYFIDALSNKAAALFTLSQQQLSTTNQHQQLKAAYQTYQLLLQYIARLRSSHKTEGSKLLLAENTQQSFEHAMQASFSLATILPEEKKKVRHFTFHISEQSKAILLLSGLQDTEAKVIANIPSELLEKEKKYKLELSTLEKNIAKLEIIKTSTDGQLLQLRSAYLDGKRKYDQLIEQFEAEYPDYFQLKYNTGVADIAQIRQRLPEESVLLSFFIGEKNYYIFVLTEEEFETYELPKPKDFEETIYQFTQAIAQHHKTQFIELSRQIYKWLLAPVADLILDPFEEIAEKPLIIIPHGILNYLPFEALIYETPPQNADYHQLSYLLRQCIISYHYSATLWLNGIQKKALQKPIPPSFAGFAPIYTTPTKPLQTTTETSGSLDQRYSLMSRSTTASDDGWNPLPYSKMEVKNVQQLFQNQGYSAKSFLYQSANKMAFIQEATKAKFLLIAAHGLVNDEQPSLSGLVFYPTNTDKKTNNKVSELFQNNTTTDDSILSMQEAYLLRLQADLVVLSSCESGIGKLAKGEGMMAVNRGFLHSGASNVIFTLFKVYDEPSSELIRLLFAHILEEQPYAVALRNAKLIFLQKNLADPKFWTSYILIG